MKFKTLLRNTLRSVIYKKDFPIEALLVLALLSLEPFLKILITCTMKIHTFTRQFTLEPYLKCIFYNVDVYIHYTLNGVIYKKNCSKESLCVLA